MARWPLRGFVLMVLVIAGAGSAAAAGPPEAIMKMLNEAARADDPAALDLTATLAKRAYPSVALEIDRTVRRLVRQRQREHRAPETLRSFRDGWTGEGEVGASHSGGNTNETSINIAFNASREDALWRNHLSASADYKQSAGQTTVERFVANTEDEYKFNERLFAFGLLQWERDTFAGFRRRFSESAGFGYSLRRTPKLVWDVTAGPALRQTSLVDGTYQSDVEARLGTHVAWFLSPTTTVSEDANFYLGPGNRTYQSVTALTTKVIGALSARASLDYKKETAPPSGLVGTDTITRLTLVYGF